MVDDFYNEQEQWEQVKRWMRENGLWLLAGVIIGVLALAGWRWYQERIERRAQEASARYDQILDAFRREDRTRGATLVEEIRRDYPSSPYADQADLVMARALIEQNELGKAAERLTRVVDESDDPELRQIARLRLARVQLAQGNADQALATLAAAEAGAFAPRYQEARGDIYLSKGDKPAALREYRAARAAGTGAVLDTATLDLKINDLIADGVAERAQ
jgi:predicted negative regulator of RcsB-dependent stress response